jgi:hypothetical protein
MAVSLKHSTTAAGQNNPSKQVSVDAWNNEHSLSGTPNTVLGFDAGGVGTELDFAGSGGSSLVGFLQSGTDAVARTLSNKLTELVSVKDFGAKGDGSTDDTAAFTAAFAAASKVYAPAGTYIVSAISVPANTELQTDGFDTIIKRKSGIADGTRIVNVTGSNVRIGDIAVQGLIASETGEQNHGIFIQANSANGSLRNISIGNVKATDIRGDAVYIGSFDGTTYSVEQVTIGNIYANNCWRVGLTVADAVSGVEVASIVEGACGQHTIDLEPNGTGSIKGVHIGYVKGRHIQCSGGASQSVELSIDAADLDLAYGSNSTPANPVEPKVGSQATGTHNAIVLGSAILRIGRLRVNGYTGQAIIQPTVGLITSQVIIGSAGITACCSSDTAYNSYIQATECQIGKLKATTTLSTHSVFSSCTKADVAKADVALVGSSKYMSACTDCNTDDLVSTAASGNGGILLSSCTRCFVGGGLQAGDRFFSFCTRCTAIGVDSTMVTGQDVSPTATNTFNDSRLDGTFYHIYAVGGTLTLDATGTLITAGALRSTSATSAIGYNSGAGGTVTQATSKSTAVTLNKPSGAITLNNAALAAATAVSFTLNNSLIGADDELMVRIKSGNATAGTYKVRAEGNAAGSRTIILENVSAGSLSEAVVVGFILVRGATS